MFVRSAAAERVLRQRTLETNGGGGRGYFDTYLLTKAEGQSIDFFHKISQIIPQGEAPRPYRDVPTMELQGMN